MIVCLLLVVLFDAGSRRGNTTRESMPRTQAREPQRGTRCGNTVRASVARTQAREPRRGTRRGNTVRATVARTQARESRRGTLRGNTVREHGTGKRVLVFNRGILPVMILYLG